MSLSIRTYSSSTDSCESYSPEWCVQIPSWNLVQWTVWVPWASSRYDDIHGDHFTFSHKQPMYFASPHLNQTWWEDMHHHTVVSISQYLRTCLGAPNCSAVPSLMPECTMNVVLVVDGQRWPPPHTTTVPCDWQCGASYSGTVISYSTYYSIT